MAIVNLANLQHALKSTYADGAPNTVLREHPIFAMIKKVPGFVGDDFTYTVQHGRSQGIGSTIALARSHSGANKGKKLTVRRVTRFGIVQLGGEAIHAAVSPGAVYDAITASTDAVVEELVDSFSFDLFRNGTGVRARIASISTNEITLTDPNDTRNFKIEMTIGASSLSTGLSPRAGVTTVTKISESTGKITVASAAAITGLANNDYLFREGDPGTCMEGMALCTPVVEPGGADSFRGANRSEYPEMLAGSRLSDSTTAAEELWGQLQVQAKTRSPGFKVAVTNPITFHQIQRQYGARVKIDMVNRDLKIGFEYMTVTTGSGALRVYTDPDMQKTEDRLFDPSTHYIRHLGALPHMIMDDKNMSIRLTDDDGIEYRWRSWMNYIQTNPACHGVVYRG